MTEIPVAKGVWKSLPGGRQTFQWDYRNVTEQALLCRQSQGRLLTRNARKRGGVSGFNFRPNGNCSVFYERDAT